MNMTTDLKEMYVDYVENRQAYNKRKTLDLLIEGGDNGVTSTVLKNEVSHRFGGCIADLREEGYSIGTIDLGNGVSSYRLVATVPFVKVDNRPPMEKLKADFRKYSARHGAITTAQELELFIGEYAKMELRRKAGTKYSTQSA